MVDSRIATALVVGAASVAVSALLYAYTGSVLFFLFLPFVPILFRSRTESPEQREQPTLECTRCGFTTQNPEFEYCPRDGRRLYER